jgi:cold shock CspA family protein
MEKVRLHGLCTNWKGAYGVVTCELGDHYLVFPAYIPKEQSANRQLRPGDAIQFTPYQDKKGRTVAGDIILETPRPPKPAVNLEGTVTRWCGVRQFGFIRTEDFTDYFVHYNNIVCAEDLYVGQNVVFDAVVEATGKARAMNVRPY